MKETNVALQAIQSYSKMDGVFQAFKQQFFTFLASQDNPFPVTDIDTVYDKFKLFNITTGVDFKFTHDAVQDRFVGAVFFQIEGNTWVPVLVLYFDEQADLYFEDTLEDSKWNLKTEKIEELITAQVAAGVMERNTLERFVSFIDARSNK